MANILTVREAHKYLTEKGLCIDYKDLYWILKNHKLLVPVTEGNRGKRRQVSQSVLDDFLRIDKKFKFSDVLTVYPVTYSTLHNLCARHSIVLKIEFGIKYFLNDKDYHKLIKIMDSEFSKELDDSLQFDSVIEELGYTYQQVYGICYRNKIELARQFGVLYFPDKATIEIVKQHLVNMRGKNGK